MGKAFLLFVLEAALVFATACTYPSGGTKPGADTGSDRSAPTIAKAEMSGTAVTLTMSEGLSAREAIRGDGGFALTGSGVAPATNFTVTEVAALAADAKTVTLTVDKGPKSGETVKLTYTQPAEAGRVKDKAGNPLASITAAAPVAVTVKGTTDTSPPADADAVGAISSSVGTATYSDQSAGSADKVLNRADEEAVRTGGFRVIYSFPAGTFFENGVTAVLYQGTAEIAAAAATAAEAAEFAALSSAATLTSGTALTLKFRDAAGNVSSGIKAADVDTVAPTVTAAEVEENALGAIILTLSENVTGAAAAAGGFTVSRRTGKVPVTVSAVASGTDKVTLTLSAALTLGEAGVGFSYAAANGPIRDTAVNPLGNLTDKAVNVKGTADVTAPPDADAVTTLTWVDGTDTKTLSNQSAASADKVLNKADEAVLQASWFRISYGFATGTTFETGSRAVLYQGTALLTVATATTGTAADFGRLGTATLTSRTELTLKFRDAAGNVSSGIKAADVDTVAPGKPTAVAIEDVTTGSDAYISLADIDGATNPDSAGIDVTFNAGAALGTGSKVKVTGFNTAGREFTGLAATTGTTYRVTIPKGDIVPDGSKSVAVRVTDAAGNSGEASAAVTLTVDTAAPTVTAAEVEEDALGAIVLTLSENVTGAAAAAGGFTVSRQTGKDPVTVTAVASGTDKVTLTLSAALALGETGVRVGYAAADGLIRDTAGNPLGNLTDKALNVKGTADVTAPPDADAVTTLTWVDGTDTKTLSNQSAASADKVLNKADEAVLQASGFKINYSFATAKPFEAGSRAVLYQGTAPLAVATATTGTAADFGRLGTATLTSGTALTLKFRDAAGNVSSGIKAADVDTVAPTLVSVATHPDGTDGIVLTFNEAVTSNLPEAGSGGFSIARVNGTTNVEYVFVETGNPKTTILGATPSLDPNEAGVTLGYTPTAQPITDLAGNPLAAFTNQGVTVGT